MEVDGIRRMAGGLALLAGALRLISAFLWGLGLQPPGNTSLVLAAAIVAAVVYVGLAALGGWWLLRGEGPRLLWGMGFVLGIGALAAIALVTEVFFLATAASITWTPWRSLMLLGEIAAVAAGGLTVRIAQTEPGARVQRPSAWSVPTARWSLVVGAAVIGVVPHALSWRAFGDPFVGGPRGLLDAIYSGSGPAWLRAVTIVSVLTVPALGVVAAAVRSHHLGMAVAAVVAGYTVVALVPDAMIWSLVAAPAWLGVKIAGFVVLTLAIGRIVVVERAADR